MALKLRKRWTGILQCWDCLCLDGHADAQCTRVGCACHAPGALVGLAATMPCYDCGCTPGPARPDCPIRMLDDARRPACCHRPKAAA